MISATWALAIVLGLQAPAAPDPIRDAWPDDRPIERLFQNLGRDVVALASPETAGIVAGGIGAALAVHPADDNVQPWVRDAGPSSYTGLGSVLGDGWVQSGGAIGTYVVGRLVGAPRVTHVGSDLIRAQALNGVLTIGLKAAARRHRPDSGNRRSMPSGHTSAAFASAAVLHEHFGWKTGVPAYAAAGFVGWTRVRDNHHWLSDVAMGAAVGLVAGHTVARGHRDRVWRIVPVKTSGGAAVFFVRSAGR